jgi:N-methylhydantoinase B/oxoprolinase/acetone carboxylase alpha subunit
MMTITLLHFFWTESARNAGHSAALDFDIEPGTFAHGDFVAPNGLCQISTCAWQTLMHLCMTKLVYNNPGDIEIVAPWYGITQAMTYGGINQWGLPQGNLMIDINSQGGGGHADRDGEDSVSPFFSVMADYGEIEDLETELPILTLGRNLMINNHGFGRHRGGAGVESMYMVWGVPEWFFGAVGAGSRFPNVPGLFGGYGGPSTPLTVFRAESPEMVRETLASRTGAVYTAADVHDDQLPGTAETRRATQSVQSNSECDLWILQTGGGGGFGDVLERDPESVIEDVRLGRITHRVAREVYKVHFDQDTFLHDEVATTQARDNERAARLERGKPYDEFVQGWRQDTPPAHLDFLGAWDWDEAAR